MEGTRYSEDVSVSKKDDLFKEELTLPAFEALEREFSDFVAALDDDPALSHLRIEHEKLFRALKKSYNQEKRLLKRCRELNAEVLTNAAKVQSAVKLSKDDHSTIESLRRDLEKAWAMADESHKKESNALDTIVRLQEEINSLNEIADKSRKVASIQESSVNGMVKEIDTLKQQKEQQLAQLKLAELKLQEERSQKNRIESELREVKLELRTLTVQMSDRQTEVLREQRSKEKLEKDLQDSRANLDKKVAQCDSLQLQMEFSTSKTAQIEKELNQASDAMEKYARDCELANVALKKSAAELADQKEKIHSLTSELNEARQEAKLCRSEQVRLSSERAQLERKLSDKNQSVVRYKKTADETKVALQEAQAKLYTLNQEIETLKLRDDRLRRDIGALEREKDLHLTQIQKTEEKVKQVDTVVNQQEQISLSLEKELVHVKEEVKKQNSIIRQLEREIERGEKEASELRVACEQLSSELTVKDFEIAELQKNTAEKEETFRHQQQAYDVARNDRSKYLKQATEAQHEIEDLSGRIKVLMNQLTQMKAENSAKEAELVKKSFDHSKEHARNDRHQHELNELKQSLLESEAMLEQRDAEIRRLTGAINRTHEDFQMKRREYEQIIHERDILGTQLVRRNDELALLYEKIEVQQFTLRKGESQYQERLEDMRLLKLKIKDLQREIGIARNGSVDVHDIKRELIRAHRELLVERSKVKALTEELENPMNIHRWRKLEGSDPATFEMVQKVQSLQKRLIRKTEESTKKDVLLQEKEKLLLEMQKRLARQPATDLTEQLAKFSREATEKARQVTALTGEIVMYQTQIKIHKAEVEKLSQELHEAQRDLLNVKRRGAARKQALKMNLRHTQLKSDTEAAPAIKFVGGGFAIK